jgi:type I restriction enzyme S subunit
MDRKMKDSGVEWIGEIPEEWDICKLKYISDVIMGQSPDSEDIKENGKILFMQGNKEFGKQYPHPTIYCDTCAKHSRIGDILMSVRAPVGAINESDKVYGIGRGLCSIKADGVDNSFLRYYLCKSVEDLRYYSNGSTFEAITTEVLKAFSIVLPPFAEQSKIADFLEKKVSEIDLVIEKTKASIEEYKKLKQAVITQAVTKGVRGERPMKDSGIEWIGEIPQDWEVRRVKTLFDLRDEKNYLPLEEVNLISLYTDLGVVQHADLEKTSGNKASNADGYKIVKEDDIVVNIILCWMGAIGRSAFNGVTSPAYDIYVPKKDIVESRFYHYYFRTTGFSGDCYKRGRGIMAMRWRTYSDQFKDIKVAYPPIEEQREILTYLDEKCTAIDTLISKKEQFLTELENYKKSLIYEYVTGKKEVPLT